MRSIGRGGGCAALALLVCACGPGGGNNQGPPAPPDMVGPGPVEAPRPEPLAPLEVTLSVEGGACRASVGGQAVDSQHLLERAVQRLRESIDAQGGAGMVQSLPAAVLFGAVDTPWRCVASAIFKMRRAGFAHVELLPAEGSAVRFELPVEDPNAPPPPVAPDVNRIALAADGSFRWNGQAVPAAQLAERLRTSTTVRPTPALSLDPSADAKLGDVASLLQIVRSAGIAISSDDQVGPPPPEEEPGPGSSEVVPPALVAPGGVPSFGFVGLERFDGELR